MKKTMASNLIKSLVIAVLLMQVLVIAANAQSKKEKEEWTTLFNKKDVNDWIVKIHHHEVGVDFGNTFRVEDGMIKVRYDQYDDFNDQFGHLYYKQPYSYYKLVMDYRFVGELQRGAPVYTLKNSGVMFHSQDPRSMPKEQNWPISVEMQFLAGLGDGKPRPTCNMCSPGTDVVYNGIVDPNHCINSTSATFEGDQWVHTELIVMGDSLVIHKVNGEEVLRYSKPQMGGGVVTGYDPALWEPGKPLTEGYIALQSEGQPIDFKNIELLNLEGCMDPKASNYKSYFIKSKATDCIYKK